MKKLFNLVLAAVVMAGCAHEYKEPSKDVAKEKVTFIIDSCEYIRGVEEYTHKGNCRFCAERRKAEIREIINELKK
jgi:hypothetical protein